MTTEPVISDQAMAEVLKRLDALAAKLGITAQYIYGVYVAQARVEAIRDTAFAAMLFASIPCLLYAAKWVGEKASGDDLVCEIFGLAAGGGSAICIFFGVISAYEAVGEWLNPQFWALDQLFKAIR